MIEYELKKAIDGAEFVVRVNKDGTLSSIPLDPANADYQAYLNRDNPDWGKPLL